MRRFCFAVLAGTAAAVPALFTEAQASGQTSFSAVDCSEQMNKAREPMGFPKFTTLSSSESSSLNTESNTTKLCASIRAGTDPGVWLADTTVNLSVAAAIQESADGDCEAATKQWKGALKTIGDSLPPAYTPGKDIYESLDVVSFMSLYTPKEGVAVTCTVIQCPYKSSSTGSGSGQQGGSGVDSGEQDGGDREENEPEEVPDVSEPVPNAASPLNRTNADSSTPVTASAVTAGVGGVPAATTTAKPSAAGGGGVRGGMTVRRLADSGGEEPFNALVCLFKPQTLTKGTAPFK
ncbi:SAG family member [Eimeria maxima]|uniref:SAG family member n=1 Tax=Eimeria maxima TaxID=5804 RepID=U6M1L0_EIMMA|nr:SAG family member [Eimeria maxima]CDJ58097.1 SAG family member [Eimeria maxima]